jgi:hypothetical protein
MATTKHQFGIREKFEITMEENRRRPFEYQNEQNKKLNSLLQINIRSMASG